MKTDLNEEISRIKSLMGESNKKPLTEDKLGEPFRMPNYNSNFNQYRSGGMFGKGYHHKGDDIATPSGTEVKAPFAGKITVARVTKDTCGGQVRINHGNGFESKFCHMKRVDVSVGDIVKKGKVLGLSGGGANDVGRGRSTGPHLHWELYKNGSHVDPMQYINKDFPVGEFGGGDDKSSSGGKNWLESILGPDFMEKINKIFSFLK
jgi:murein DD-endopeptidase MepM/ murein hydrolase activator NlpD